MSSPELSTFGAIVLDSDVVYAIRSVGEEYYRVHIYSPATEGDAPTGLLLVLDSEQLQALGEFFTNAAAQLVEHIRKGE